MEVKVKLCASLRKFGPDEQTMEVPEDSILGDVIERLKLPEKIPLLKVVNGEVRAVAHPLKNGDGIALFPPIAGGTG